ncbi:hypothetical protein TREAZ_2564 [Leadbettera azotonutricia ZAS-9]|uniref:Uncharacterized protein n=1 Tax=Leadbettera azotonutricia (strain ATCC BAA-888 / DSM 13862 / ZAS-9) TaxID=545695 RepID=F5YF05_LEAAZ|nr:hypothetical protein TREAZ_2564 [Leadbettera azotonutricia ZAS-9]
MGSGKVLVTPVRQIPVANIHDVLPLKLLIPYKYCYKTISL